MLKQLTVVGIVASTLLGCANSDLYSGDVYRGNQAKQIQSVYYGTIVNARPVKIQGENKVDLFGGIAGAVAGGVLGHQVGKGGGKDVATAAGAIGGGVIGEKIADKVNQINGLELEIKKDDGSSMIAVQKADPRLVVGQRVRIVIDSNKNVNVSVME